MTEAVSKPSLNRSLDHLAKSLYTTEEVFSELERLLEPLCSPAVTKTLHGEPLRAVPNEAPAPIVTQLQEQDARVRILRDRITGLCARLNLDK